MSLKNGTLYFHLRFTLSLYKTLDSFPASAAFEVINSALQSDDAERQDAVKNGQAIFAFTLKNGAGETDSWHIDLKDKGAVGRGDAPEGKKADGECFTANRGGSYQSEQ